jgi:hydrogenase expression/formation protein HypE
MRAHPAGADAAVIGEVVREPAGMVVMQTAFGGARIVDMLVGEQLPRIC